MAERPRVKLDENLSRSCLDLVSRFGYDADRATDEGLSGADDVKVWDRVLAEGRLLITLDTDFADIRTFKPNPNNAIFVLRPASGDNASVLRVLLRLLNEQPLESYCGLLVVADEGRTRTRRPG